MRCKGSFSLLRTVFSALLVVGIWIAPSVASECECIPCHSADQHGTYSHTATLGSGRVALFADNGHDDAGWTGTRPYFEVPVDCSACHNNDLPTVHGSDCATCHTTPYDTVKGIWNRGCQQGGCHFSYHEGATRAHAPFEDPYDPGNDCGRCHDQTWAVTQIMCMNCHASYGTWDNSPPVTTTNALATYVGPAKIDFSITDNGKVGIGRTFYRLNDGTVTAASHVLVTDPGTHKLEFWSKDQFGNSESAPNTLFFTVVSDTTPPTTTSDAQTAYQNSAVISMTATDASARGVKATYYRLNGGAIQSGTTVVIPDAGGSATYTLTFWSEDWTGNVEAQKSVSFTVVRGTGTIRLVWWDCDVVPSQKPTGSESASWTVRKGGWWGPVLAYGSSASPNWTGINDIAVPVSLTSYLVQIAWSWQGMKDETIFSEVYVTSNGEIVRLSY